MNRILQKEIEALFVLLDISKAQAKRDVSMLISDIKKEAVHDAKEGLETKEADAIKTFEQIADKDRALPALETAASKIMVRYYANHKKDYDEKQKEIFLTFLLTNKLKRALKKGKR